MSKAVFEPSIRISMLGEKQIKDIHNAVLEVLGKTGVAIKTEEGRKILCDAGCKLEGDNIIKIPPKLVEKCLKTAPDSITLYDRLGEPRCVLGGWKCSYGTGSDTPFVYDRKTGERRQYAYQDVADGAKVVDYLENYDFLMPMGIISDRPTGASDVHEVYVSMMNTIKPIVFTAHNRQTFRASVDLAAIVAGGMEALQAKPTICLYDEPISPLTHTPEATDKLIDAAKLSIPIIFTPCPSMGATAPGTKAGLLVQATSECLSGLVLHQLVTPGAPIIFGGVMTALDMRSSIFSYGAAEFNVLCSGLTCMAHHYELPMFGTAGCSDAKTVDAQAGLETGFSVLMATLSGQNLIHDIGYLDSGLINSFESCLLANDAIGMAKYIASGIQVNKDTLAVDVINSVGQTGNYLANDHTVKHLRKEFHFPAILDRDNYSTWEKAGSKQMDVRLKEKVDDILATHKTTPIDASMIKCMDEIVADIEEKVL